MELNPPIKQKEKILPIQITHFPKFFHTLVKTHKRWTGALPKLHRWLNGNPLPEGFTPYDIVYGRGFEGESLVLTGDGNHDDAKALFEIINAGGVIEGDSYMCVAFSNSFKK